jgi:hypothetical protein
MLSEWIKALRSGEYKQISGKLGDNNGYCCLGVACEVYRKQFPLELVVRGYGDRVYDGFYGELPPVVREAFGLDNEQMGLCMEMNDNQGKTFSEIADYLEEEMNNEAS